MFVGVPRSTHLNDVSMHSYNFLSVHGIHITCTRLIVYVYFIKVLCTDTFSNRRWIACWKFFFSVSNVKELCRDNPFLIFPHHDECQLYYNCSLTYADVSSHLEQHMVECQYPSLFSTKSLRCENFMEVCCGMRKELKNKCKNFFRMVDFFVNVFYGLCTST